MLINPPLNILIVFYLRQITQSLKILSLFFVKMGGKSLFIFEKYCFLEHEEKWEKYLAFGSLENPIAFLPHLKNTEKSVHQKN